MHWGLAIAFVLAMGCGRIGFSDQGGDGGGGGSGDAAHPSAFTAIDLPPGGTITAIERAPDGTLYAVLTFGRVVRSTSNGATWTPCGLSSDDDIENLAIDPATGVVYLAGGPDVVRSTDGCATWTATGLGRYSLAVATLGTKVFAGTLDGLWVMTTGAWAQVPTAMNGHSIWDIEVDAAAGYVFLSGDNGIVRSLDSGASWALSTTGLPVGGADFVRIDPLRPQWMVTMADTTAAGQSLYRSADTGATWGLAYTGGFSLAFDPSDPNFVAFGSFDVGMTSSTDGAATFSGVDQRSTQMARTGVFDLAFDATSGLYAATGRGIFYAPTHALAWSEIDAGIAAWDVSAILTTADGSIYLATDAGVMRSGNGGNSWTEGSTGIINSAEINSITAVPGATNSIVVASINSVARSDDRGQTFSSLFVPGSVEGYNVFAVQIAGTKLVAGTGNGVLTSTAPWSTFTFHQLGGANRQVWAVLALDAAGAQLLAASDSGIFYSGNGGTTFSNISNGLTDLYVNAIAQLPDGTLLAGTDKAGVFRASSPAGPWSPSGLNLESVHGLFAAQGRVLAATSHGVFVSTDGAITWQPVYGLEQMAPRSFAVDASGQLLVGSFGWGLFRAALP